MARKEFVGLLVSSWVGELCVNGGVLDIGMAEPVFDKGQVGARVLPSAHNLGIVFRLRAADAASLPTQLQYAVPLPKPRPPARDVPLPGY